MARYWESMILSPRGYRWARNIDASSLTRKIALLKNRIASAICASRFRRCHDDFEALEGTGEMSHRSGGNRSLSDRTTLINRSDFQNDVRETLSREPV